MRKKIRPSRENISRPAYLLMKYCLMLSAAMLSASLLVSVYAGGLTAYTVELICLRADLYRMPQSILLVAAIGSLYIDAAVKGGR